MAPQFTLPLITSSPARHYKPAHGHAHVPRAMPHVRTSLTPAQHYRSCTQSCTCPLALSHAWTRHATPSVHWFVTAHNKLCYPTNQLRPLGRPGHVHITAGAISQPRTQSTTATSTGFCSLAQTTSVPELQRAAAIPICNTAAGRRALCTLSPGSMGSPSSRPHRCSCAAASQAPL